MRMRACRARPNCGKCLSCISDGRSGLLRHDPHTGALTIRTPDSDLVDKLHMTIGGLRAAVSKPDLNPEFRAGLSFALNKIPNVNLIFKNPADCD